MPEALRPLRPAASLTAPRPLSVRDRLILDIARRGPDSSLHLGGLLLFDGPAPTTDELAAHLASRVLAAPELTYRLAADDRLPAWAPDPAFDVSRHIHRVTVPGSVPRMPDATLRAVLDQPLDRDRPLWGIWLVQGEGDGFALCYRAHHAFQDGRAAAETLGCLFGPPAQQRGAPKAAQLVPAATRGDWGLTVLKDLLPPVRPAARWPALSAATGAGRTGVTASCDLAPLHAISRTTRATVTQICLAAVTGALRAWHPETWAAAPGRSLRATFAISLRTADDPLRLLGNHGGVATVPLPCGEPSPLRHLSLLQREVTQPRLAALGRRHRVLFDRLPYWCGRLGLNRGIDPRYVPLTLADVRTRSRLSWAGQAPVALFPVPVSVPGQPLFVAWTTFGGRLHVTFVGDAAVPGLEGLPALWRSGLAALGERAREG
ncbi:wax ester/triacylglycerol synthase domain-containing protein [Streptomyces iconiensis]|uniref:Wax ester/triacylglycerol synthase family O-acyltransferase n=1 Tax=Streptomyces iconiensis TaxID=1384038 RepID=A0ABT7A7L4_9ACTN|nr:wax ester/triacylglycerol synthase domain-containing protein [Streptomyces iconiensis]MDJ1137328.1 wax ester/triacylglycerol synthase family O-acyltransferase [Streptomyces iconiensis]